MSSSNGKDDDKKDEEKKDEGYEPASEDELDKGTREDETKAAKYIQFHHASKNESMEEADTDDSRFKAARTSLPLISLSHGLGKKATPFSMQSWVALALTLDGRDKLTKVVQYASRFLAWWFLGINKAHSARFKALFTNVSKSRKAFRLGRSFIELEKLKQMGLLSVVLWHLRVALGDPIGDSMEDSTEPPRRPHLPRKASSNIGWGPATVPEENQARRLYRSVSNMGYRMYRPLVSQLSMLGPSTQPTKAPAWKVFGTALKLLGLLGFWAGDNFAFFTSTGFLDNYTLSESTRLSRRKHMQTRATKFAFRCYFMGAVSGLLVNFKAYWMYRREVKAAHERLERIKVMQEEGDADSFAMEGAQEAVKQTGEKQFVLFLALLKSCCDTLVFSNNTGIDLHKKYRGKKMHEGFHCLCGLLSASTVLYNNYPNAE